jgi:hypothetical protein
MNCRHNRPHDRLIGEVDDQLLSLVRAACHYDGLRLTADVCMPDCGIPYMRLRLSTVVREEAWVHFFGYN